ncbi:MAG: hypothetical protein ACPL5I_14225 [Thermodesulfobacteriota bacterium]
MEPIKGSNEGKLPSPKSLDELMKLLLKLNTKLREKLSPRKKKAPPEKMDVVIIIMTSQEEKAKTSKAGQTGKRHLPKDDWIKDLVEDIEKNTSSP